MAESMWGEARVCLEAMLAVSTTIYVAGIMWFARGVRLAATRPSEESQSDERATPFISVIVAARNEASTIRGCLEQLSAQTYPSDSCEVIIVDDGSDDGTASLVRAFQRCRGRGVRSGPRVTLLSTAAILGRSGSKKSALGLGIDRSRGEIIATTDADCRVPPTWLQEMATCFEPEVGMVIGFSQIESAGRIDGLRQGWEGVDFLALMAGALGSARQGRPMAASGQNLAFRKCAFTEVGGYSSIQHRVSGDDVLLLQLIRRTGRWKVCYATSHGASVVHPASVSWRSLLNKRSRWASNAPFQLRLDPVFFAYLCATFGMSLSLAFAPALVVAGALGLFLPTVCWTAKTLAEWTVVAAALRVFGRRDLARYFLLWSLTQPFLTVAIGLLGCLWRFSWKGRRYWWGRHLAQSPT